MAHQRALALEDFKAPPKLKICALWAATMFCYVYGDYFGLFMPGRLAEMNAGEIGPLGSATLGVLLGVSIMMAIPSVMVFLSLVLPPSPNRRINIVLGVAYAAIMLLTTLGAPPFYVFFGVLEISLNSAIVWCAWTWPRRIGEV